MEVILLEKIENLGSLGDVVSVRAGYARNYLLPQKKATMATETNIADFESRRAELEKAAADSMTAAIARKAEIDELTVHIKANAGQEGKLFGSVSPVEISEAILATGVTIERSEIRMPEGPIRSVGEYRVDIHLHTDVDAAIKVIVESTNESGQIAEDTTEED